MLVDTEVTVTFNPKRLLSIWSGIKDRCHNERSKFYSNYGGRGIRVHKGWRNSFSDFAWWALHNGYSEHLTLDRKNNDHGYSPRNCRWITLKEQQSNKRTNRWICIDGEKKTLSQWSRVTGVPIETLRLRHEKGVRGKRLIQSSLGRLKIRNIYLETANGKDYYRVRFERKGKRINVGSYSSLEIAIEAKERFLKGEAAC